MLTLLSLVFALQSPAAPFGTVLSVSGLVSVEPKHLNLKAGVKIEEGDRLAVMSDSQLRIKLETGAVVEVGPQSEISFHRNRKGAPYVMLPNGSILMVATDPTPLEIRSGQLRAHLHGRAFFFEQRSDQHAYLCVCDGEAKANWGGQSTEISGKLHHHGTLLSTTRATSEPGPKTPLHHSDSRLTELRKLL
jgi:hypothetical protein